MKFTKLHSILVLFILFLVLGSCSSFSSFTEGNFEPVVQGSYLEDNVDTEKLHSSIRKALQHYNWKVTDAEDGVVYARFTKSEGLIVADIQVVYDQSGYYIEYLDSKNLDYNERKSTIHKNYVRWIANLDKSISVYYFE